MPSARIQDVIISDLELRGRGTPDSPMRRVTQVYDREGNLIAERDGVLETAIENLIQFANVRRSTEYSDRVEYLARIRTLLLPKDGCFENVP